MTICPQQRTAIPRNFFGWIVVSPFTGRLRTRCVNISGRHVVYALMRTLVIIQINYLPYIIGHIPSGINGNMVQPFRFQDTVHPLGYSVLQRVAALRHADRDLAGAKFFHILGAAILHTTVRVVNQSLMPFRQDLQGHFQSPQRVDGIQAPGHVPAHYLVGVHIRYQTQVAKTPAKLHIRNIAYP